VAEEHIIVPNVDVGAHVEGCVDHSNNVLGIVDLEPRRHQVERGRANLRWGGGEALSGERRWCAVVKMGAMIGERRLAMCLDAGMRIDFWQSGEVWRFKAVLGR
jgi:hypothetical protein